MEKFKFIDLFSGIGGFHQAMSNLGGECVFASEIDPHARETYTINYGLVPHGDITKIDEKTEIPQHDVLCAGFPCQAFSKAGHREGLEDTRGTLFFDIARILKHHKTKYIILENVRNLVSHDNGNTWKVIARTLHSLGYRLTEKPIIISPHYFGIPQLRERVVIIGVYDPNRVDQPLFVPEFKEKTKSENNIDTILQKHRVQDKYYLDSEKKKVLDIWDEFYNGIEEKILGFPIWTDNFKKGSLASDPDWKKNFINKNNELYLNNKKFIDSWLKKHNYLEQLTPTNRKFEWQAGASINSIFEGVIQFRPSGVRVKRPDTFPALVAMVQTPVIGKYKRKLTVRDRKSVV